MSLIRALPLHACLMNVILSRTGDNRAALRLRRASVVLESDAARYRASWQKLVQAW
jgi:hypothetical protein